MTGLAAPCVSALDHALLAACPVVVAPAGAAFAPLTQAGRRIVIAESGVFVEARSDVLYARMPVGNVPASLPYGPMTAEVRLLHGSIPLDVWRALRSLAHASHPNEMAALILWSEADGYTLYQPPGIGSPQAIQYADDGYASSTLVIDGHSHGQAESHFSAQDDASDCSRIGPHVSVVFGRCESPATMSVALRVCIPPFLCPLSAPLLRALFA